MITGLTPQQAAMLPGIRDEWLAHGLSTQPADRPAAEQGIRVAYRAAGLNPPRFIIWLGSPWAGIIGQAVAPGIIAEILGGQVDGQVRDQVDGQVRGQVDGQVYGQMYGQVRGWWRGCLYGQQWAGHYSHYAAMEAIGVTGLEPIHGQQQVARSAGWWWVYRDFAVITERPRELHRDVNGELHSPDSMAITYPDGWGFWCWHGRRVPEWVIAAPDVERIAAEPNVEVRRCAIESLGWDRFTEEAGLVPVGRAPGTRRKSPELCNSRVPDPGNPGQHLILYDVPERLWGNPVRLLMCTNGSEERSGERRKYGLTVPADISDPIEAAAWTAGLTKDEYALMQRRT
jgi:hypothetical protein